MTKIWENQSPQQKNLSQFHLSTTNPTRTGLGPNLGFQVERLESEYLSHGMAWQSAVW